MKNKPAGKQASSHMLWFFIIPCFLFLLWTSYKLTKNFIAKKPKATFTEKIVTLQKSKSDNSRWKAAYELTQYIFKNIKTLTTDEKNKASALLSNILIDEKSDTRLKKYIALTLAELKNPASNKHLLDLNKNTTDKELKFYSAWALLKNAPESDLKEILNLSASWVKDEDSELRRLGYAFLISKNNLSDDLKKQAVNDPNRSVKWNIAIALANKSDKSVQNIFNEIFSLKNIREFGLKSSEELTQFINTANNAYLKIESTEINKKIEALKSSIDPNTPEGKAILKGLEKDNS